MTIAQQDFDATVDELFAQGLKSEAFVFALAERYPDLKGAEFNRLMRNSETRLTHRALKNERRLKALEVVAPVFEGSPSDTSVGSAVDLKASQGDPLAIALREHFDSPAYRLQTELIRAAVAAHPDWTETPEGRFRHRPPRGGTVYDPDEAIEALLDWFGDEHTAQAAAIYERIMGKPLLLRPG